MSENVREFKIRLQAEDYKALDVMAANAGIKMQDLCRDKVLELLRPAPEKEAGIVKSPALVPKLDMNQLLTLVDNLETFSSQAAEAAKSLRGAVASIQGSTHGDDLSNAGTTARRKGVEKGLSPKMEKLSRSAKKHLADANRGPGGGDETDRGVPPEGAVG